MRWTCDGFATRDVFGIVENGAVRGLGVILKSLDMVQSTRSCGLSQIFNLIVGVFETW